MSSAGIGKDSVLGPARLVSLSLKDFLHAQLIHMLSQLPSHFFPSLKCTQPDEYVSISINILAHERRLSGGKFTNWKRLQRFSREFKEIIREQTTR